MDTDLKVGRVTPCAPLALLDHDDARSDAPDRKQICFDLCLSVLHPWLKCSGSCFFSAFSPQNLKKRRIIQTFAP